MAGEVANSESSHPPSARGTLVAVFVLAVGVVIAVTIAVVVAASTIGVTVTIVKACTRSCLRMEAAMHPRTHATAIRGSQAIMDAKIRRAMLAVAAWLSLCAVRSSAQTLTMSCADAMGRPVQSVQRTNSVIAKAGLDESGRPIIDVDSRRIEGVNAQEQLFVYAHECGHHALGHDVNQPYTAAQERAADCQAIQVLTRRAGLTSNDVMILQTQLRDLPTGSARRLGPAR